MPSHFEYLVLDGKIVRFEDAKLHILTPAVKYGATAFEGLRAYWNEEQQQLSVLHSREHMARLLQSAKLMGMQGVNYSVDNIVNALIELLRANEVRQDVHIRPSLFVVGDGPIPARGPVSLGIAIVPMKRWAEKPFRLAISSWRRLDDNCIPPRIKCAANYQNGRLALIQAMEDGYDGVLMLDAQGHVTEEPRACFFMVRKGIPITPPVTSEILESITRESLVQLLREEHGLEVQERVVDRTEVYVADEIFLCGSGFEISPVGSVDHFAIGNGEPGPVTVAIAETYMGIARRENGLHPEWCTPVYT